MWEWRLFSHENIANSSFLNSDVFFNFETHPIEKRTDYYYNLSKIEFGLKERGNSYSKLFLPKLELKILLDRKNSGLELWNKCVKTLITNIVNKKEGLAKQKIIKLLKRAQKFETQFISRKIGEVIQQINLFDPPRIEIRKSRKKFALSHNILNLKDLKRSNTSILSLEYTVVELLNKKYYSICVEGTDNNYIQTFVHKYLYEMQGMIMGYPEFIMKVAN